MFGGIVEGMGRIKAIEEVAGAALRLAIDVSPLRRRPRPGDSVSVAGVCLTVVSIRGRVARFDVIGQTVRCSTLGDLQQGDAVNLEGALCLGDPIGGHQVEGHVDGVGTVTRVQQRADETWVTIRPPAAVQRTLADKGFVSVEGVSLTVASLGKRTFSVALIPTTLDVTTLGRLEKGSRLNLEGDPIGKHVARWLDARNEA